MCHFSQVRKYLQDMSTHIHLFRSTVRAISEGFKSAEIVTKQGWTSIKVNLANPNTEGKLKPLQGLLTVTTFFRIRHSSAKED